MNIIQLKTFITLAECNSFSEAARKMKVTRPAVAGNIKALEKSHDVNLFNREGRRIKISELGRKLLPLARTAESLLREIESSLKSARSLDLNFLTIGVGEPSWGIELISIYKQRYPGVHIQVVEGTTPSLLKDLEERKIDIAVIALTEPDSRFVNLHFYTDKLFFCVPKNHPWANRKSITLSEICTEKLILPSAETTCRRIIDTAFSRKAVTAIPIIEFEEWDPIIEAIVQGMGNGFLQGTKNCTDPRLVTIDISDAKLRVPQYIVCPSEFVELRTISALLEIIGDLLPVVKPSIRKIINNQKRGDR